MSFFDPQVPEQHDLALKSWYAAKPEAIEPGPTVDSIVLAQHFRNFSLWNLEDEARRRNVTDQYIAEIKRAIDKTNQSRNDLVERIDQALLTQFDGINLAQAEQHSETAGMMIDRLSILSLKIWHMNLNATTLKDPALAAECAQKVTVLKTQRQDLYACLERLLEQFQNGQRFFKSYKQFKQYNDPRLNPALRAEAESGQ
ncbi:MAG: DUF4254 domain-containing protein [Acidobacteria bacterium]|nr:DUF4254 domain-containing protein [Acidobacteriota bacterium]